MVVKVENVTSNYHQVIFCQSVPITTPIGPRMVAIPQRTLSRSLVGVRHWAEDKFVGRYLALIGYCELALNMGVPVMQEFALTVLSWGTHLPKRIHPTGRVIKAIREERDHPIIPLPITPEARESFWEATGISPVEQRAYEQALRSISRHGSEKATTPSVDQPARSWAKHWSAGDSFTTTTTPTRQSYS